MVMNNAPQSPKSKHLQRKERGLAKVVAEVGANGGFQDGVDGVEVFGDEDHGGLELVMLRRCCGRLSKKGYRKRGEHVRYVLAYGIESTSMGGAGRRELPKLQYPR